MKLQVVGIVGIRECAKLQVDSLGQSGFDTLVVGILRLCDGRGDVTVSA